MEINRIVSRYQDGDSLKQMGKDMKISTAKIRKILITAGEWESELSREINKLYDAGYDTAQISEITGRSRKSVNNYLPYSKGVYKGDNASANALRIRKSRKKKKNVE